MSHGVLTRVVLIGFALLLILQAIFARSIGKWKVERVRRYPQLLQSFFAPFPPCSQLTADIALVMAVVGGIILIGLAFLIQFN